MLKCKSGAGCNINNTTRLFIKGNISLLEGDGERVRGGVREGEGDSRMI